MKRNLIFALLSFLAALCLLTACSSRSEAEQIYFSPSDLEGRRVGVGMGYGADVTVSNLGIFEISRYLSASDLPIALKAGNIDAFAMEKSEAELISGEIPGLVILPEILGPENYVAVSAKDDKILAEELDAAITIIINSSVYPEMKERWLSGDLNAAYMPDIPKGTGEKLVAAISSEYMPFEYFGEGGERLGFDIELILRIGALLDREIVFYETAFTSLFLAVDSGYADFIICVIDDKPALHEKYAVSRPYYDNVIVMVVLGEQQEQAVITERMISSFNNHLVVEKRYTYVLEGLLNTLIIFAVAAIFGTLLGALLCAMIRGKQIILHKTALFYVRVMQGTPIIVLLLFITYVALAGSGMDTVLTAGLAFSLYFSAKASEIFRAGLDSVDKGQIEASKAMGLSGWQTYRLVLVPQASILSLPVYCADMVEMLKLTSVVGYVGVMDLTYAVEIIRSRTYEASFPLLLETVLYIILTTILTRLFMILSAKIDPLKKARRIRL
jgi:polar amino acid transport system substrate-binding protein